MACWRSAPQLRRPASRASDQARSEEHTSELQSLRHLVCRLLLEKKKTSQKHIERKHYVDPRTLKYFCMCGIFMIHLLLSCRRDTNRKKVTVSTQAAHTITGRTST